MEDGSPSQTARRVAAHRLDFSRVPAAGLDPDAPSLFLLAQLVLWSAIGLIFAPLADRLLAPGPARAELRRAPETAGV